MEHFLAVVGGLALLFVFIVGAFRVANALIDAGIDGKL